MSKKLNNNDSARLALPPTPTMKMTKAQIITLYQNVTGLVSRAALAGSLGQTFGGERDLYEIFGWKKQLNFRDYFDMYDRNGMAGRVVDSLTDETWRTPPTMMDGLIKGDEDNEKQHTEFLKAWNVFVEAQDLWALFNEMDASLGYSRYAIMLIGAPGKFDQPLDKAKAIKYIQVYDEGQAQISSVDRGINSLRYGMPELYNVTFEDGGRSVPVHYSRVIHFKDRRGQSRVYGAPRLKKPFNYLSDLEKVVGASSEAFWLLIRKGLIMSAQEGQNFPQEGSAEFTAMQDEISEWEHQLRRVMRVKGVDVTDLGAQVVDGKAQHDLLITDISGTVGIPNRVLVGSERGELASSSDDANWAAVVESRQKNTCTKWVKDTAKRLIELGAIPAPTGKMGVEWAELFQSTALEKMQTVNEEVTAINGITNNVPDGYVDIEDFLKKRIPDIKISRNENPPSQENVTPPEAAGGGMIGGGSASSGGGLFSEQLTTQIGGQ